MSVTAHCTVKWSALLSVKQRTLHVSRRDAIESMTSAVLLGRLRVLAASSVRQGRTWGEHHLMANASSLTGIAAVDADNSEGWAPALELCHPGGDD